MHTQDSQLVDQRCETLNNFCTVPEGGEDILLQIEHLNSLRLEEQRSSPPGGNGEKK